MDSMKILLVEDDPEDLAACAATARIYRVEKGMGLEIVECRSVEEAEGALDNSFDGAIVDLRLEQGGTEGVEVLRQIEESFLRIPVAIFTGTPSSVPETGTYVGVFTKGEARYSEVFDVLAGIFCTGVTRLMGGRGLIEERLTKVFRSSFLPQRDRWVEYGGVDSGRTEKALLRHVLSHLLQLLDEDEDSCFPEEVYLSPPLGECIRTGTIVRNRQTGDWWVVMSPACDLVGREEGKSNTDRILTVEIRPVSTEFPWYRKGEEMSRSKQEKVKAAFENKRGYSHWLPETGVFCGGFLNFRKVCTVPVEDFQKVFETPAPIQISPSFLKDIVARFSSYYARQGQPSIDLDGFL